MAVPKPAAIKEPCSKARLTFAANSDDIRNYYHIHQALKSAKATRQQLVTFDKAMYVLVAALWESYCEDVISEALDLLAKHAYSPADLPLTLQKVIASDLRSDKHELAVWKIAGDGWKDCLRQRLDSLRGPREWLFNSPKSSSVDDLFARSLGIERISDSWRVNDLSVEEVRKALDRCIAIRGAIAHRAGTADSQASKIGVKRFINLVISLVRSTDMAIENVIRSCTELSGWQNIGNQSKLEMGSIAAI
ncbi:HEPN domain-containing protein [Kutzneria kofuensis]|uniref:RiboL-PSP-HEPN domain-containing protein n=1 Tax=Kutzneria kofuensis TaxID=103725 RepID=A0A7W9NI58_9PSEU|nr:HEPN domain-containing protein [Kutzneria kofuensis]MBB5892778.1 hypothetical protein [Kutzneria kofuensis]